MTFRIAIMDNTGANRCFRRLSTIAAATWALAAMYLAAVQLDLAHFLLPFPELVAWLQDIGVIIVLVITSLLLIITIAAYIPQFMGTAVQRVRVRKESIILIIVWLLAIMFLLWSQNHWLAPPLVIPR
jgi:hypothetical protein